MITVKPTGTILFEVILHDAERVEILGDFTDWGRSPIQMERRSDGVWSSALSIAPGVHHFRYRIDGWRWITDFAAHGVSRNEFGDWNSRLCVALAHAERRRAA